MNALLDLPPWHVACRADVPIAPDSIAGILDGDGSLALHLRPSGTRPYPVVTLGLRDDDPTVIAVARPFAAFLGRPVGTVAHVERYREWRVKGLADVVAVARFLRRHPLLSPRGALQLDILEEASSVLLASRRGPGTVPLTALGRVHLLDLRAAMPGKRPVSEPLPLPEVALKVDDHRLGGYVGGLAAAEGCYHVARRGSGRADPVFSLSQRVDNLPLLELLRDRLGMGAVRRVSVRTGSPAFEWLVSRDDDVNRLAAFFAKYPLPASSPKAVQAEVWTELVALRAGIIAAGARGELRGSPAIGALVAELRTAKQYAGPTALCTCPRAVGAEAHG